MKRIIQHTTMSLLLCAGFSSTAYALEAGDWLVRLRAIDIVPTADSDSINAPALGGHVPGSYVDINSTIVPELDFTYMATRNIGFELILATSKHTVSATGTAEALGDVLSTWVLPPTLTAQYHFFPESVLTPYVGAGINYTIFYNEELDSSFEADDDNVSLESSFGFALQAGADIWLKNDWFINVDVKYIDIGTKATIHHSAVGSIWVDDVDVNPWVYGVGIGKRF